MTYGEIAEIPSKIHIFYEQAFDILFYKHDASKGMFRREVICGLPIDDFKDILSSVATSGYIREEITHSNTELISYIRKAKRTFDITKLNPDKYKNDLLKTVCVLIQDGNKFTYNHRSFQEYFAALFLIKVESDDKIDLYNAFLQRGAWDNALYLVFEINRGAIEQDYIRPTISKMLDAAKGDINELMKIWFSGIRIDTRNVNNAKGKSWKPYYIVDKPTIEWDFLTFLEKVYCPKNKSSLHGFSKILTKKKYLDVFSERKETIQANLRNEEDRELLESLGITQSVEKRMEFLKGLLSKLTEKGDTLSSKNLKSWL